MKTRTFEELTGLLKGGLEEEVLLYANFQLTVGAETIFHHKGEATLTGRRGPEETTGYRLELPGGETSLHFYQREDIRFQSKQNPIGFGELHYLFIPVTVTPVALLEISDIGRIKY